MRLQRKTRRHGTEWKAWFAWFPVLVDEYARSDGRRVGQSYAWLERVLKMYQVYGWKYRIYLEDK
jgi:hypothetical protein